MKRAQLDYKEADTFGFFDGIRAAFPAEIFTIASMTVWTTTAQCSS